MRRLTTTVAGCSIATWTAGTGPAVVCVHGAGVSSRELRGFTGLLAARAQAWCLDLPGFGESGPAPGPPTLTALADALAAWLRSVGLAGACLLGSSFGCQVATDVAVRYPDLAGSLVLAGPTCDPLARTWPRTIGRWLRNMPGEDPRMAPLNLADYRDCGPRRALAAWRASMHDPIEGRLPAVRQPTLVVRGERDAMVPQSWAEEVTRLLPDGRLRVIEGAPHMIPYRAPRRLADETLGFLAEVSHEAR
jgi:pimeloyl-ACP methyl ester carboxylesterase